MIQFLALICVWLPVLFFSLLRVCLCKSYFLNIQTIWIFFFTSFVVRKLCKHNANNEYRRSEEDLLPCYIWFFLLLLFNSLIFDRWSIWTAQLQQHDKRTTKKKPSEWLKNWSAKFFIRLFERHQQQKKLNIYRHSWFDLLNAMNNFYENFDKVSIYDDHDHYWIISWLSLQKQFECLIFILVLFWHL